MSVLSIDEQPPLRFVRLDTGRKNALTLDAIQELAEAFGPDEESPVVVLSGRPGAFCVGLDNATLAKGEAEREEILAAMGELLFAIVSGPTRLVAVCEGHAVAGGAMLLLVADLRIGTRGNYKIGFTEPAMGMPLPSLPAILARERLDRRRLHAVTVLGRTVGPDEAVSAGFLDEVVETEEMLRETTHRRAIEIAALTERAYRGTLESVWGAALEAMRESVEAQSRRRDATRGR
jgi:enoyl-CoA hydratase